MPRIMGIDPGLSGALALQDTDTGEIILSDMPLLTVSTKRVRSKKTGKMRDKTRRSVDGKSVADWVEVHNPDYAVVEKVSSRPKQGVVSVFSFGEAFGKVCGAVEAMNVPLYAVMPAVWKREAGLLGLDKQASIRLACKRFPGAKPHLKRKKDNGRAEALLLTDYPVEVRRKGNRRH